MRPLGRFRERVLRRTEEEFRSGGHPRAIGAAAQGLEPPGGLLPNPVLHLPRDVSDAVAEDPGGFDDVSDHQVQAAQPGHLERHVERPLRSRRKVRSDVNRPCGHGDLLESPIAPDPPNEVHTVRAPAA